MRFKERFSWNHSHISSRDMTRILRILQTWFKLEDVSTVSDKDKIRILPLQATEMTLPVESISNSLTFSTPPICAENVQDVIIFPCHTKLWPDKIILPTENFSKGLKEDLDGEIKLSWDRSRELVGHLANYAYSFKPYPNKKERLQVCHSLVRNYPYLRNDIGFGIGGWELKLLNKLKKLRQADTSLLEVKLNRCNSKVAGSKVPKHLNINPKKGELNWSPDHIAGETPNSVELHKKILKDESLKSEKYQNKGEICTLMALTYSFRREQINNKILISDLKTEYPIFFQKNEQFEEFQRLTCVNMEVFYKEVANQGTELYRQFNKKKKTDQELLLLANFNERCLDMESKEKLEAQIFFGFFTLPYLLREDINSIFKIVSDDDDTPDYESSFPKIFIHGCLLSGTYIIISENIELNRSNNFIDAIGLLMCFYYTLNISYPITAINTLKFIQNNILKIHGGSIPPKVQTLIKKINVTEDN